MSIKSIGSMLFFAALLAFAAGCHKKQEGPQPSPLAGPLMSRMSQAEVDKALKTRTAEWEVVEDLHPLAGEPQTWRQLRILRRGFSLYGQSGDMELAFYNDKLVGARFFAVDYEATRRAAAAAQKIGFDGDEGHLQPSTWVYRGRDENGRVYLGWIDKVMQAERDAAQR